MGRASRRSAARPKSTPLEFTAMKHETIRTRAFAMPLDELDFSTCDDDGNYALMSCQHATRMGAFAGNNAAAELLGVPTKRYHQKAYVTCLDLGEAGALFTRGWDRKVELVGDVAKKTKQEINTVWIYPPKAERAAALASADPEHVTEV